MLLPLLLIEPRSTLRFGFAHFAQNKPHNIGIEQRQYTHVGRHIEAKLAHDLQPIIGLLERVGPQNCVMTNQYSDLL